ncbi:MAG: 1-acyl-sn-glycerol-3-phosphate acyltransferase [Bdellovibrionaceae bacterium]|nr:1-acyl-sn-glycerol-3-phosphate acyltransferase [Pseudobdellovibrionaceae bacterium]
MRPLCDGFILGANLDFILRALSYPRSVVSGVLFLSCTLVLSLVTVLGNMIFNNRAFDSAIISFWGRLTCRLFGVKVVLHGLENLPTGGCILAFNHTSFFDIFSMIGYIPDIRFGAKIELFRIPLFGWAMRRTGILPIPRQNREEAYRVYEEAEARLRAGEKFALAPEGTRQQTQELGKFKAGPFIFAIRGGVPVVPVVIKNAAQVLPKGAWLPNFGVWSSELHIHILPPVPSTGMHVEDRGLLQRQVHAEMAKILASPNL